MRIIGGELRGRRIVAVPGRETRPSADRLREAVFNILAGQVAGKRVLDLFAGTGALGIEALSRGAQQCVFVDHARQALATIARNLEQLGLGTRARVLRADLRRKMPTLPAGGLSFELVFMDPPYSRAFIEPSLNLLRSSGQLHPDAQIVVEHSLDEKLPDEASGFCLIDRRRYGNSIVSFLVVGA